MMFNLLFTCIRILQMILQYWYIVLIFPISSKIQSLHYISSQRLLLRLCLSSLKANLNIVEIFTGFSGI